jgi:hypothetical protein
MVSGMLDPTSRESCVKSRPCPRKGGHNSHYDARIAGLCDTSVSTDHSLGGLYLAYRGTTGYRPGSAMKLFHDGQSIGWYNNAGLT